MSINQDYITLARDISGKLNVPDVVDIYLPEPSDSDEYKDEFGFVCLSDDTVGPFYTSLPGQLDKLWQHKKSLQYPLSVVSLVDRFDSQDESERAVALGAFNALSHFLFKAAGYDPTIEKKVSDGVSVAGVQVIEGEWVGMVGYFCPLIDKINAAGGKVLVLEKQPGRVVEHDGCKLTQTPSDLARCQHILCTASTLVNGTLESLLEAAGPVKSFNIIGPSGSGLPDLMFQRGISSVGGVMFKDIPLLRRSLEERESWKGAGHKYLLKQDRYPGVEKLLEEALS